MDISPDLIVSFNFHVIERNECHITRSFQISSPLYTYSEGPQGKKLVG